MNRPLPDEYLEYAARDAYLIYSVYDAFSRAGYLSLVTVEQSMRYINLHRRSPPHRDNIYGSHPLLPLGIVGEGPIDGLTRTCLGCNRTLHPPLALFARGLSNAPIVFFGRVIYTILNSCARSSWPNTMFPRSQTPDQASYFDVGPQNAIGLKAH